MTFLHIIIITVLHNIIMIKLNEPGVRLGLVLNLQLNSVLAEWTHLLAININIDIIVVVLIAIFRVLEYQKRERDKIPAVGDHFSESSHSTSQPRTLLAEACKS